MLEQMWEKSIEKVTSIYIDKKGMGSEKDRILSLLSNARIRAKVHIISLYSFFILCSMN